LLARMITTQVIDIHKGEPARRIPVELDFFIVGQGWREVGHSVTGQDGRIGEFGEAPGEGVYRLMYDIASYMPHSFFPSISVTVESRAANEDHHVILQISPFGYSVCRAG
jgi:5-hydroxyisourate hydrolase-like protein (transthyretin family)